MLIVDFRRWYAGEHGKELRFEMENTPLRVLRVLKIDETVGIYRVEIDPKTKQIVKREEQPVSLIVPNEDRLSHLELLDLLTDCVRAISRTSPIMIKATDEEMENETSGVRVG
jgi:hypothetical protein